MSKRHKNTELTVTTTPAKPALIVIQPPPRETAKRPVLGPSARAAYGERQLRLVSRAIDCYFREKTLASIEKQSTACLERLATAERNLVCALPALESAIERIVGAEHAVDIMRGWDWAWSDPLHLRGAGDR